MAQDSAYPCVALSAGVGEQRSLPMCLSFKNFRLLEHLQFSRKPRYVAFAGTAHSLGFACADPHAPFVTHGVGSWRES